MPLTLDRLYADRMALYRRFMNRELDRKTYLVQLAAFDEKIDRLELSVLRSCEFYQRVCAAKDPMKRSKTDRPDKR